MSDSNVSHGGNGKPGGHEGAREADADETVARQHLARKQLAAFTEAGGVVGLKRIGDELRSFHPLADCSGIETEEAAEFVGIFLRRMSTGLLQRTRKESRKVPTGPPVPTP